MRSERRDAGRGRAVQAGVEVTGHTHACVSFFPTCVTVSPVCTEALQVS